MMSGMSFRVSAGILLYRVVGNRLEVLLAHMGGPLHATRDLGSWTIPKGEPGPGEELLAVARREFGEETGHPLRDETATPLGSIVQKGGKVVHAWAVAGDLDPAQATSNTFRMAWPPGSGQEREFPEIDRVAWFDLAEARRRIKAAQEPFIDRLELDVRPAPEG
jgi:predicted NUDIX family NTP pyrophosphohydrolase